jgi:outer membrane protein assembly factor BamE (lipoprotein component of BamABCDE complex)
MRSLLAALLAAIATLVACDPRRIDRLEEGLSTEADVRAQFGEPEAVYPEPDGSRTLEYPRQPEGQVNYMITIGPDGKMSALRQVLKQATFDQVSPGMDKAQLRRLLGRPATTQVFPLKQEEVWDWRYLEGQEPRVFSVTLDPNGKVVASRASVDPREMYKN